VLKLKVISCDVLNREISYLASKSQCFVDVTFLRQGLHLTPKSLGTALQQEIDRTSEGYKYSTQAVDFDYIIIGYGLCSNGIIGISSKKVPLVIPRAHDCITLLLGSKERYREYFDKNPGTYWFSPGWIERGAPPSKEKHQAVYLEYVKKYGEENAQYLVDMEQSWLKDYKDAALINWGLVGRPECYREITREIAGQLDWNYVELDGESALLNRILNGIFNENEVLLVPPGDKVVQSFDENIIKLE